MTKTCDIAISGVKYGLWSRSKSKSYDQDYSNWQNYLTTFAKVLFWKFWVKFQVWNFTKICPLGI